MYWVLIYLTVGLETVQASTVGAYETMTECFEARESLKMTVTDTSHFPLNQQAICIQTDKGL